MGNNKENKRARKTSLREYLNTEIEVSGTVIAKGYIKKMGISLKSRPQVLLRNIRVNGLAIVDHIWVEMTEDIVANLTKGDVVSFMGEVYVYERGLDTQNNWKYGIRRKQ